MAIGPSGKVIKSIIAKTDTDIDIEDETGRTYIYGRDAEKTQEAYDIIKGIIKEYKVGETVEGKVFRIEKYGAFVKIDGTEKEGLIHISNIANRRLEKVEDALSMGQVVTARITEVNEKGQIGLSMKKSLSEMNDQREPVAQPKPKDETITPKTEEKSE